MIVTWQIGLRLAAIVVLAVVLQISFLAYLPVFGVAPDLVSVTVVALGLLGGALTGAVAGFATGLVLDSVLLQTLGVSSLVLLSIGYVAGRYREQFEIAGAVAPALLAGGLTLVGTAAFIALQLTLGVEATVSLLVAREVLVKALLAFVLMLPVYPLLRAVLRSALVLEEPGARRRVFHNRRPRRGRRARRARTQGVAA